MAIKETLPFNFDEVYTYIETKFGDRGYDLEEGSNTMQLVTAMSYLVSMLNANTATNINETLLTLARKRTMVLKDARVLGYEIDHITSYQYDLLMSFQNDTGSEITRTIPKYSVFTSGDYKYYYMGSDVTINIPALSTVTHTITVIEGDLKTFTDFPDTLDLNINDVFDETTQTWGTQHYIDVPFTDVENDGIEVFLTYYDTDATYYEQEEWKRSVQFMIDQDTILRKEFVRLDNIEYKTPRIYFKIGDVGQELRSGTIIQMNVLQSSGTLGEITGAVSTTISGATVVSTTLRMQGAGEESLESIRSNAPLYRNTANRVITKPDYIAFSNRQAEIKISEIWDGQDEFPHWPGHIWFSFIPSTNIREITGNGTEWTLQNLGSDINWYIEDSEIESVWGVLENYKVPTLEFHHRHPIYYDFDFQIRVARYTVKTSEADVNLGVFTVINNYFLEEVESFWYEYFQSNLIKRIDSELTDIMGFDISIQNSISLSGKNMIEETNLKEIRFHLGLPFLDVFDEGGNVIFQNLPTINFTGEDLLTVDEGSEVVDQTTYLNYVITSYNIMYLGEIVGKMRVFDGAAPDIEIIFYIKDVGIGHSTGLDENTLINTGYVVEVVYPTPNIRFNRNTIPRLKSVTFI